MRKTIEELKEEILEYEEIIGEVTSQFLPFSGDENDEEFEKEISYYEMLIINNQQLIDFIRNN